MLEKKVHLNPLNNANFYDTHYKYLLQDMKQTEEGKMTDQFKKINLG